MENLPQKEGIIKATDKGFGFLEVDNKTSFFIPPEAVQTRLRKRRWAILGDQDSIGFLHAFQPK